MGDDKIHAELSPSSADRWMTCAGSVALSRGVARTESRYAQEGTDHHEVAALCLEEGHDAATLVGRPMLSGALLTEENAVHVQTYLNIVRGYRDTLNGEVRVEESVPISFLTGELHAKGTADAVIFIPQPELIVVDLKFGMGVEVSPDDNRQLKIYAAAVLQKHEIWEDYKTVRLVIVQPRTGSQSVKEWVCTIDELQQFCVEVRAASKAVRHLTGFVAPLGTTREIPMVITPDILAALHPSEKACKFCPAKAGCPALKTFVEKAIRTDVNDFENEETKLWPAERRQESNSILLGVSMDACGLVEIWLHAVRAKVESELLAGHPVQGVDGFYKLVRGRKGNRKWDDADAVKGIMETYKLKSEEMFDYSLISASTAEKRFAKKRPHVWEGLHPHITQSEGSLSVADAKDPRPAVSQEAPAAGFETEDGSDLL